MPMHHARSVSVISSPVASSTAWQALSSFWGLASVYTRASDPQDAIASTVAMAMIRFAQASVLVGVFLIGVSRSMGVGILICQRYIRRGADAPERAFGKLHNYSVAASRPSLQSQQSLREV